jgi:membrane protease YdiL (CAAX protease family)
MERPNETEHPNSFGCYMLLIGFIIAIIVLLQIVGISTSGSESPELIDTQGMLKSPVLKAFTAGLIFAAIAGLGIAIVFLANHIRELAVAPRPRIQPSVLLISFIVFLISFFVLSGIAGVFMILVGADPEAGRGVLVYVIMQTLVMIGAFTLGFLSLTGIVRMTREDPREIGWRLVPTVHALLYGIGGYIAALPFMLVTLIFSQVVFRGIETPEHPIVRAIIESGTAYAVATILAVIVAPIVEETFFRGMLYTALRSRLGVWWSSLISGVFFAAVHPTLPGGFLPILALGIVLAILREKTGSLLPSIICHGANNAVALVLVKLVYPFS